MTTTEPVPAHVLDVLRKLAEDVSDIWSRIETVGADLDKVMGEVDNIIIDAKAREVEATGLRVVSADATAYDPETNDHIAWEITDWRTDAVLKSGPGGYEEMSAAWEDDWIHIDRLYEDDDDTP